MFRKYPNFLLLQRQNSPNSYQDFIMILLPVSKLTYLVLSRIYLIAGKIGKSLGSYQEYSAKSVSKQGEEVMTAFLVKS
jgi:hypothetical protein